MADSGSGPGSGTSPCAWCAGTDGEVKELRLRVPDQIALNHVWVELHVHPWHERALRRFLARFRRYGRRFVLSAFGVWHAASVLF